MESTMRQATLYTESSDSFVASAAASISTGWSEPVPGRELRPLKSSAFHGALLRQLSSKARFRSRACGIYFINGQNGVGLGAAAGNLIRTQGHL
jgi:hypothetical protein